jgi:hypothetical protein
MRWKIVLERVAASVTRSLPDLEAALLLRKANALGRARIPAIFAPELRPLDASLNDGLLDLLARTERVVQNRFVFFNQPQTFAQHIQWEGTESSRWHAELHSFDFALDLGMARRIFGEKHYAQHLRYLIADWIASNPPFEGPGWAPGTLSRRVRNWILAADLARSDWEADAQFFDVASQSLALQALFLNRQANQLSDPSEQAAAAVALLLAARAFESSRADSLSGTSLRLITMASEDPTDAGRAFQQADPARRLLKARAMVEYLLFDHSAHEENSAQVRRGAEAALARVEQVLLPDGRLSLLGSSGLPSCQLLDDTLALAAALLGAGWCKTIAPDLGIFPYLVLGEEGKQRFYAIPSCCWKPEDVCKSSSEFLRLVGPDASAAIILAEPNTNRTAQQDFLSYELILHGQPVIVGASRASDPAKPGKGSLPLAHNVLLLEGEAPFASSARCSSVSARLFSDAGSRGLAVSGGEFARRQIAHGRVWLPLQDGSWLICDRLEGRPGGRLKSLLHFYPAFELALEGSVVLARSHSLNLSVIPIGSPPDRIVTGRGDHPLLPSWYSPAGGVKYAAGAIAIEWEFNGGSWLGGYLITPQASPRPRALWFEPGQDYLLLEIAGQAYRLPLKPFDQPRCS